MIHYKTGDATDPTGVRPGIIAHICNDLGAWGSGFVLAVSGRWTEPEALYRAHFGGSFLSDPPLGHTQIVMVDAQRPLFVANMIAQRGKGPGPNKEKVDRVHRVALATCLTEVFHVASKIGATVHMPKIGTGLGGAPWEDMEAIINIVNSRFPQVACVVYTL